MVPCPFSQRERGKQVGKDLRECVIRVRLGWVTVKRERKKES